MIMIIEDIVRYEKKNNLILMEKLQKYQYYGQVKLKNVNIVQVEKHYFLVKVK